MSLEPYQLANRTPVTSVKYKDLEIGDAVSVFEVTSFRRGTGDTAWLRIPIATGFDGEFFERGAPVIIQWGLDSEENLLPIFDGVVREVKELDQAIRVELVDYMTLLHAKQITTTIEDENTEAIICQLTRGLGLQHDLEASGLELKKFPVFNRTVFEAMTHLAERVKFELGKTMLFWIRNRTLYWQSPKQPAEPVVSFVTGLNINNRGSSKLQGYSWLTTGIAPVLHGDTIEVDGDAVVAERVYYKWSRGCRSKIYWKHVSV
ncbi:MAG: hypothetical protein OEM52_07470 [bacterium]|nr:hypothetical protein [bacterium]